MNAPLKIAIGLSTLGATGGGAYLLHQQLSKESILKKLEQEGYTRLAKGSTEWDTILSSYKATIADSKNTDLKFEGLEGTETKDKLQAKCEEAFNKESSDDVAYKKAKKWCTNPKKLTEILKKIEYSALNSNINTDENQSDWNKKLKSYDSTTEPTEKRFGDLNLKTDNTLKEDTNTRNKLKTECKKLDEKKHYEKDFETNLEKAKLWCAIQKPQ